MPAVKVQVNANPRVRVMANAFPADFIFGKDLHFRVICDYDVSELDELPTYIEGLKSWLSDQLEHQAQATSDSDNETEIAVNYKTDITLPGVSQIAGGVAIVLITVEARDGEHRLGLIMRNDGKQGIAVCEGSSSMRQLFSRWITSVFSAETFDCKFPQIAMKALFNDFVHFNDIQDPVMVMFAAPIEYRPKVEVFTIKVNANDLGFMAQAMDPVAARPESEFVLDVYSAFTKHLESKSAIGFTRLELLSIESAIVSARLNGSIRLRRMDQLACVWIFSRLCQFIIR